METTSDRVTFSIALAMSEPYISISKPDTANSLKLVAIIKQERSPFPDRAVTLLTTGTILDNGWQDAFFNRRIESPTDVTDDKVKIYMYPFGCCIRRCRKERPFDLRQRENSRFLTVPPVGQGNVDVVWSFAPERIFCFYRRDSSLEERLKRVTVGQRFKIEIGRSRPRATWWTWGSLQHDLRDKKFSRWSLPHDLPVTRELGQDEDSGVGLRLVNITGRKNLVSVIRKWYTSSEPDREKPPKVKKMRAEGWVFGEPPLALEMVGDGIATFEFVE